MLICKSVIFAQKIDADVLLKQAIEQTNIKKNYPKAIQLTQRAIQASPNYADLHLLLGRLYLLTKKYQSSRTELQWVLTRQPKNLDALTYLINVETATGNFDQALTYCDQYLSYADTDEMRQRKVAILNNKKDGIAAAQKNRIGVGYDYTFFDPSDYHPWNFMSLYYIRDENSISYAARINYVNRRTANGKGYQFELEAYPKHKNGYSYIDVAYANTLVFPKLRLGYSYFRNLQNGWEGELGARYLKAGEMHLTSLALSIGKYWGNNWINLRPFVTNESNRFYLSTTLTGRKYFDNKDSYLMAILGYGNLPDERGRDFQFGTRYNLNSYRLSIGFQQLFARSNIIGVLGTYNKQELVPGRSRNEFDIFINYQRKF